MPSFEQIIVWIIVGLIGGSLAGLVIKWERKGFGFFRNLGIGLIGALIGGLLFRMFGLFPNLDRIAVSARDIVAAFVGALIVLLALWLWKLVATKSAGGGRPTDRVSRRGSARSQRPGPAWRGCAKGRPCRASPTPAFRGPRPRARR